MAAWFRNLPLFVVLILLSAGAMLIPAAAGMMLGDFRTGRLFFYSSLLVGVGAWLIGIALQAHPRPPTERTHLVAMFAAYLVLPVILSIPMQQAVGNTRFINVYFDMVSAFTTTGAVIFEPDRFGMAVHLWRATVGWLGGLLIWISAMAILAPLNLGGYEVTSEAHVQGRVVSSTQQMRAARPSERLRRSTAKLTPVYVTLTAILALLLMSAGEDPIIATIHAMSTLSTSGISPVAGLEGRPGGILAELLIFLFLFFALSRRTFTSGFGRHFIERVSRDREIRLALFATILVPTLLFARHWMGAWEVDELTDLGAALSALWGSLFTVLSFLTTTGFVSEHWDAAASWSGLGTPGIVLIGLVLMGGGVATSAGGLKLLRVYALYKHGARELGKLIYPHSVAGAGRMGRRIRREGAYIAWIFFMLFIIAMAATMTGLAATGLRFEPAMILSIAALSTTGSLAQVAGEAPIAYVALSDAAKLILAAAMVIGRIETLVLIALFNPAFWRS
ncbi:hypothetical protein KUV65_02735 [Maritalea mobilis]|uniref:TrkH family potassium uptake protein n=1 Tax=Maritalea mobilis TaxID=483324 RepID=UPI001C96E8E7|nr:potassium transporter TrkG [Maritalea mobilis]MBY6200264.1 hypothetical protein [Maritalea mobilis]